MVLHKYFCNPIHSLVSPQRACFYRVGGPQVGEAKCGGSPHLTCKRDQIKVTIEDVTLPKEGIFARTPSHVEIQLP